MERGYMMIKEEGHNEFIVEAKLVDGNLWLTQYEIAGLFNVCAGWDSFLFNMKITTRLMP